MRYEKALVWLRNDLRWDDNLTIKKATELAKSIVPVYCLDPRQFGPGDFGLQKTGIHRARFLLETLRDLQEQIAAKGGKLLLLRGHPEKEIPALARDLGAGVICFSQKVTEEEIKVEEVLEKEAWQHGIATESYWQSTLFHIDDLPFPVTQLPEMFTRFRKECEKLVQIRPMETISDPVRFTPLPENHSIELPDLQELGCSHAGQEPAGDMIFKGGSGAAWERIHHYFWQTEALASYKQTRNGLLGADYSSKFSLWLGLGALSARQIYWEIRRFESEKTKNQSTYWLIFELIWRDFFRFIAKKHGNRIFQIQGIQDKPGYWKEDREVFLKWTAGETGIPFIDANMRELNQTGFMSNRGRQLVASFLVNDLEIDWRWGAAYFEQQLIDYDPCSNWGNWMYIAGVGNDPRQDRYFNILLQAKKYDPQGEYIARWIPELAKLKGFDRHVPFQLTSETLKKNRLRLGNGYPVPLVSLENWSI
ncbi:DASH family cryptochrome [Cyclobacterium jeungdonense]|uniref:Cryptochrome DASH n=1 Tax=Cyclobacterium jeungdonense TaxID=708087 RepID=A0ABT8CAH1_9BACT|nr:DASH family cryptochrome [Cyclobacterium jeungdonense]MDN3689770.1 DASH family cryptochrome [Cyclobacterium jeungdonense]